MRLTISGTVGVVALNLVLGGLIGGVILIWKLAVALWYQELAEQYAVPNLGMCPFHQKGQVLYSDKRYSPLALGSMRIPSVSSLALTASGP